MLFDALPTLKFMFTAFEDPISSTSSEICTTHASQNECLDEDVDNFAEELSVNDINLIIMGQSTLSHNKKVDSLETEEEFLNLNINSESSNNVTEDVEDIVHDLENLLDESADSCRIAPRKDNVDFNSKQKFYASSQQFTGKCFQKFKFFKLSLFIYV